MWTPERDAELRSLGAEAYISRHPGSDADDVRGRYMLLVDPEGRAALLREKNRSIEEGRVTKPPVEPDPTEEDHPTICPRGYKKTTGRPWTPAEIEKLKDLLSQRLTSAEIGEILGRTETAVNAQRSRLGIKKPPAPPQTGVPEILHTRWTDKDIAILTTLHGCGLSARRIGEELGRSVRAVKDMRHRLGLRRSPATKWT